MSAVPYPTVTCCSVGPVSVTVNVIVLVPLLPSFCWTSLTASEGCGSSSLIVTTPCESAMNAPWPFVRFTKNDSAASLTLSFVIGTWIVLSVLSPAFHVTVPLLVV